MPKNVVTAYMKMRATGQGYKNVGKVKMLDINDFSKKQII